MTISAAEIRIEIGGSVEAMLLFPTRSARSGLDRPGMDSVHQTYKSGAQGVIENTKLRPAKETSFPVLLLW